MNYHLSPKQTLAANTKFAGEHRAMVQDPGVELHLELALSQYVFEICEQKDTDPNARAWRIQGAHEFLKTFRNLAETAQVARPSDSVNLNSNR